MSTTGNPPAADSTSEANNNSSPDSGSAASKSRRASSGSRSEKNLLLPDATFTLPPALNMAVDYAAYMSKYSGKQQTPEEVIHDALIAHMDSLRKRGIEMPPSMQADFDKLKAPLTPEVSE